MSQIQRYSLSELRLAEELLFPENAERLFQKHFGDVWQVFYLDLASRFEWSLLRLILNYSRADYERGLGQQFEGILNDLLRRDLDRGAPSE